MERILKNKFINTIISIVLNIIPLLFITLGIFIIQINNQNILNYIEFTTEKGIQYFACIIITILIIIMHISFIIKLLIKKHSSIIEPIMEIILNIILIIFSLSCNLLLFISIFLIILSVIFNGLYLSYLIFKYIKIGKEEHIIKNQLGKNYLATLIINGISILSLLLIFFIPLYSSCEKDSNIIKNHYIISGLIGTSNVLIFIFFIIFILLYLFACKYFFNTLKYYFWKDKKFSETTRKSSYFNFAISTIFFLSGNIIVFYLSLQEDYTYANTISFVPFIIISLIIIIHSFVNAKNEYDEGNIKRRKEVISSMWLILVFITAFTFVTIMSLFLNLIEITGVNGFTGGSFFIRGIDLIKEPSSSGESWLMITFIFFAIILISSVMYILSIISLFTKNLETKRIGLATIIINFIFIFAIGLFSKYYEISSKINIDMINEYIQNNYGISYIIDYDVEVTSGCFGLIFVDVILAIALFILKPFTKASLNESEGTLDVNFNDDTLKVELKSDSNIPQSTKDNSKESSKEHSPISLQDFDACPAFTELDSLKPKYDIAQKQRLNQSFESPSLAQITKFIVDYARESRLHLSYTQEDIASFIAGLGATKLSILQGMSGTGKTSLPKIFLEALMGNCEIIEVESSWKDKNELIGYYNEFTKTYTPKKFTRALYKASLNPDVLTFIVLDEMNLSRIEYYFSDFLSLMENEPHQREIQLCNVSLVNTYENKKHNYINLINGHTLHIPENVWFIGTANRDESTFEISDKVYDRAHTMNFNKRAPKVRNYQEEIPQRYLSYNNFQLLINKAINEVEFELEDVKYIKDLEQLLRPYNISFGNRIMNQIENYVKVYISCFKNGEDLVGEALERILLTKVIAKLEFKAIEDKDSLIKGFEKLNLDKCAEFVRNLNEDF